MMSRRRSAAVALAVFLAASSASLRRAAGGEPTTERVIFVRGASILSVASSGEGTPSEVARLPAQPRAITRMESSRDGRVVLLESEGTRRAHWVKLGQGSTPEAKGVDCAGDAGLSPNGRCLVCPTSPEAARVIRLRSGRSRSYAITSDSVRFLGPAGREILAVGRDGIWAHPLRRTAAPGRTAPRRAAAPRRLAPHRPLRALSPAPDGTRAVAVYSLEDETTLDSFRLDGKAARRTLLRNAEPVAWSASSEWLLAQQEGQACIARAVGGEYKCWRGFVGAAIAADGSYAILAKPVEPEAARPADKRKADATEPADAPEATYDLYRAELAGAQAARPKLLVEGATSAAALVSTGAP